MARKLSVVMTATSWHHSREVVKQCLICTCVCAYNFNAGSEATSTTPEIWLSLIPHQSVEGSVVVPNLTLGPSSMSDNSWNINNFLAPLPNRFWSLLHSKKVVEAVGWLCMTWRGCCSKIFPYTVHTWFHCITVSGCINHMHGNLTVGALKQSLQIRQMTLLFGKWCTKPPSGWWVAAAMALASTMTSASSVPMTTLLNTIH